MKNLLFVLVILSAGSQACTAQKGYQSYATVNGVEFSYKWGTAKDETGQTQTALMLQVKNPNRYAVSYAFDIDIYFEGILRETSGGEVYCIKENSTSKGKLNGTYFIVESVTKEETERKDFKQEINQIKVEKVDSCQ